MIEASPKQNWDPGELQACPKGRQIQLPSRMSENSAALKENKPKPNSKASLLSLERMRDYLETHFYIKKMNLLFQTVKLLPISVKFSPDGKVEEAQECSKSTYFPKLPLK